MEGVPLRRRREAATAEAFNVVSRLSDIRDILSGSRSSTAASSRSSRGRRAAGGADGQELDDLIAFIADLPARGGGVRFTPEQADTLGTEAQERATAIAGQVSQAAAKLGVEIEQ